MNNFEQKIIEAGKSVRMTDAERTSMRAQLISHANLTKARPVPSPYMIFSSAFYRHTVSVAFVAVLFFTGGLSAIADKALPGAFLYPFKTGVNEKVLSLFAVSPNSKKQLQITLAERRLKEAEIISADPTISQEIKTDHAKTLNNQITRALEGGVDDSATEKEQVALPISATVEDPTESRKIAPTTMMMSATLAPEPEVTTPVVLKKEEALVSAEEIGNLRQSVDNVRALLAQKKKIPEFETESISFEAKLLRAQKALFDAGNASSTPSQKLEHVKETKSILTQVEKFLKKESQTEIKSNTPSVPGIKKEIERGEPDQVQIEIPVDVKI